MSSRSVTIKAAWISGGFIIAGAIIGGIFLLLSNRSDPAISNIGSGQQIIGNKNILTVNNLLQPKSAYLDLLENTDIHLGDNMYPNRFGVSYNPLTQDIYPQPVKGVVFFDKKTGRFVSDDSGQTQIGQYLVSKIEPQIRGIDFSAYKYVLAVNPSDSKFVELTEAHKDSESLIFLGSTALIADASQTGNFYNRFAAIGYAQSFSLVALCRNAGIDPSANNLTVSVVIKSYHGGIRPGQSGNFRVRVNEFESIIPSTSKAMRDPSEVEIPIPPNAIHFDKSNYLFIYVLPWVETGPILKGKIPAVGPAHFRDIGIISIGVSVHEG